MPKRYEMEWVCFVDAAVDDWIRKDLTIYGCDVGWESFLDFVFHLHFLRGLMSEGWMCFLGNWMSNCRGGVGDGSFHFISVIYVMVEMIFWPVRWIKVGAVWIL